MLMLVVQGPPFENHCVYLKSNENLNYMAVEGNWTQEGAEESTQGELIRTSDSLEIEANGEEGI